MRVFDQRHKWGPPVHVNATISRTCRVCGRTDAMEVFVPDSLIDHLVRYIQTPNPYRALIR